MEMGLPLAIAWRMLDYGQKWSQLCLEISVVMLWWSQASILEFCSHERNKYCPNFHEASSLIHVWYFHPHQNQKHQMSRRIQVSISRPLQVNYIRHTWTQVIYLIFACVRVSLKASFSQGKLSLSAKLLSAAVEAEVESKDENMDDIGGCYSRVIRYDDFDVNKKIKCGRDFWQFQLKFDATQLFLSWSAKQGLKPAYLCLSN